METNYIFIQEMFFAPVVGGWGIESWVSMRSDSDRIETNYTFIPDLIFVPVG